MPGLLSARSTRGHGSRNGLAATASLLLVSGFLVSSALARPPEPVDLTQGSTAAADGLVGAASATDTISFYFEDFESGPGGWEPVVLPVPPIYWNRLPETVHYATGFEAPEFVPGSLHAQDSWGVYAGLVTVQETVVHSGTQAVAVDRTDGGDASGFYRFLDMDLTGSSVDLGISVNLSSGDPSYWTPLHVQLEDSWIDINVEPGGQIVVVFPGPIPNFTGAYVTRDTWFDLDLHLDFRTRTASLEFDGAGIFTGNFPGTSTIIPYCLSGGQFSGTADFGYFDDFSATSPPSWWCGTDDPCILATPPGYGNLWDQRLDRVIGPLPPGATLEVSHSYDVEEGWDYCFVEVSDDGGTSFGILAEFTGNSGGPVESVIDLSLFAGESVLLRFAVITDSGWSDQDGEYDSDGGAWLLSSVRLDGAELLADEAGWVASTGSAPPPWTSFRLEGDPVCALGDCPDSYGQSWVAYDAATGQVPMVTSWGIREVGIESPDIPLPSSYDQIFLDMSVYLNLPLENNLFMRYEVLSLGPDMCPTRVQSRFIYFGVDGWSCSLDAVLGIFALTGMIDPAASWIRVRLTLIDLTSIWGTSGVFTDGVYFDNVHLMATNCPDPGITVPDVCAPPTPQYVSLAGTVSADCGGPLAGVTVDLDHPDGTMFTIVTDEDGAYAFAEVPYSEAEGMVAIVPPLGYEPLDPSEGMAATILDQDRLVDFSLACLEPVGVARTIGYWKHQANVYLNDRGHAQESLEDMEVHYPAAVFSHFYANELNGLVVSGVTYEDSGTGPVPLSLLTLHSTLTVNRGAEMLDRAKQQYLAVLLNLASGKLLTSSVVSEDGATASQVVQQVAGLINDGLAENDELAKTMCDEINNARLIEAGLVDLSIGQIAYRRPMGDPVTLSVGPTPFRSGTEVRFRVQDTSRVTVGIYNALGRRVRDLFQGPVQPGETRVQWNGDDDQGRRLASGVYYVRVQPEGAAPLTRKLVLLGP